MPAQMPDERPAPLVLLNRHTGERLELTRFEGRDGPWLEIRGSLPARSEGPPLHIHLAEDEGGRVLAGTISAVLGDRAFQVGPDGRLDLPRGRPHRWWNDSEEELVFEGYARPLVDLDRVLQAFFEIVNASPSGRPSLFYLAHALHRHRRTQVVLTIPPLVQRLLFPVIVGLGSALGRYRGTSWPGCPARCQGAPYGGLRDV